MKLRSVREESAMWREAEEKHRAAVGRKYARIKMYEAMIDEWEKAQDWDQVRELKRKLHQTKTELKVMRQ